MGIEGGPSYYVEGPRTESIEGRTETAFNEIDLDQATHVPLHDISWPNAHLSVKKALTYQVRERFRGLINIQLYTAELTYKDRKGATRKSDLSITSSERKPVFFTGTTNGFYAHDPLMDGKNNPFYVVGLHVHELSKNQTRLSSVWHELGHVLLFHTDADIQLLKAALSLKLKDLPEIALASAYGEELANNLPYNLRKPESLPEVDRNFLQELRRSRNINRAMSLFHERNAWAAGIHLVRANEYPTGFQEPMSYFKYARLCLESYEEYFNERKFVRGWH